MSYSIAQTNAPALDEHRGAGLEAATSASIERRTKSRNKPALSPAGVLTSSDLG